MHEALAKLAAKSWSELEVLESQGRLFFGDSIRRRTASGKTETVKVRIRVLRKPERRAALLAAEKWAKDIGLDPAKEQHKDLCNELDQLSILASAIREDKAPHDQYAVAQDLESQHEDRSLQELWAKYKAYEDATDPRDDIATEEEAWALIMAIAQKRNISPLAGSESHAQSSCIVHMADLALTSPAFKSFCTRYESSTPEPSPSPNSPESSTART